MPDDKQDPKITFFAELKKRKVFRAGATYAVVSWLIVQVASATFHSFGIPEWAFRLIVLTLIFGFPVVLVLAWAFELTPQGVRLTRSTAAGNPDGISNSRRNWTAIGFAAALPTVIFGTLALIFFFGRADRDPNAPDTGDGSYAFGSIAVLPLQVITGEDELQKMAEGLHEELLTQFSAMEPLKVVSRTSTLKYQSHTMGMREIGQELGADFVVEGSLRQNASRWRLTLQPIEAATDLHLATMDYDFGSDVEDPLLFQKEAAWRAAIDIYQAIRKHRSPTPAAAEHHAERVAGLITDLEKSEGSFWGDDEHPRKPELLPVLLEKTRQIAKVDPDNAVAHRKYLAFKAQDQRQISSDPAAWQRDMKFSVARALRLDPDHFDTQIQTGTFFLYSLQQPDLALPYLRKGLALYEQNADYAYNWPYYQLSRALFLTGSPVAALKVLERVPNPPAFSDLDKWAEAYEFSRQFGQAIEFLKGHLARATREGDERAKLDISGKIAAYEAWWTGSLEPLRKHYKSTKNHPLSTPALKAMLLLALQDYDGVLREMNSVDPGTDPYAANNAITMTYRAFALRQSGNRQLAESYLSTSIATIKNNAAFLATVPGNAYATLALLHSLAGNKPEALAAAKASEANLDASRNLPLYYFNNSLLARAYVEAGEIEKACERLELILSGPTGTSTGRVLVEFRDAQLFQDPRFQAVIRKHVDQLKDPAILEQYFSKSQ